MASHSSPLRALRSRVKPDRVSASLILGVTKDWRQAVSYGGAYSHIHTSSTKCPRTPLVEPSTFPTAEIGLWDLAWHGYCGCWRLHQCGC